MRASIITPGRVRPRRKRGLFVLVAAVVAAGVAVPVILLLGDGEEEQKPGTVSFQARPLGIEQGPDDIPGGAVGAESRKIVRLLEGWYQQAFVDPSRFGDGTFPEVRALFEPDAQAKFDGDLDVLTIGEARTQIRRVDPTRAAVDVTIYFDDRARPSFAVADVDFRATVLLTQESASPVSIVQSAVLHLRRQSDGAWRIFAYDATQNQDTVAPTPSP